MNERILELAVEANDQTGNKFDLNYKELDSFLEKFAELIIRECIGCCEQVISDPVPESVDSWLNGGEQCIQEIKQRMMSNLKE